ncbi:MAG: hypothetical protein M3401_18865 [Actinomycetota bacterium]|nr:hypothetical protein [Actinomycetota bacterium]
MSATPTPDSRDAEVAALQARVAALESELALQAQRTARVVAEAQEKLYWLERWQVDLDAVMSKPGAVPALEALKRVRSLARQVKRLKRRLLRA